VRTPAAKRWAVRVLAAPYPRRHLSRFRVPEFPDLPDGDDPLSAAVFFVICVPLILIRSPLWLAKLVALLVDLLVVVVLAPVRGVARILLRA